MKEIELIGDICQLSLSDLFEFAISYIEHESIGDGFICNEDIITNLFGGRAVGYRVIEVITSRSCEVMAYIPKDTLEMYYLRTLGDGVFVYARTSDDVNVG